MNMSTVIEAEPIKTDSIDRQIDKLRAEQDKIKARAKRRQAEYGRDEKRWGQIYAAIHKLELTKLVGIEGAVKIACRFRDGDRCAHLIGLGGTILKIRRTRATVLFNGHRWNWTLGDLKAADQPQGMQL